MSFERALLDAAHRHCSGNREEIAASKLCGCFFCLDMFPPSDVGEWLNPLGFGERTGPAALSEQHTAFCPKCMIDSVLGDASKLPVRDPEFLTAMQERWFGLMGALDVGVEDYHVVVDGKPAQLGVSLAVNAGHERAVVGLNGAGDAEQSSGGRR